MVLLNDRDAPDAVKLNGNVPLRGTADSTRRESAPPAPPRLARRGLRWVLVLRNWGSILQWKFMATLGGAISDDQVPRLSREYSRGTGLARPQLGMGTLGAPRAYYDIDTEKNALVFVRVYPGHVLHHDVWFMVWMAERTLVCPDRCLGISRCMGCHEADRKSWFAVIGPHQALIRAAFVAVGVLATYIEACLSTPRPSH